MQQTIKISQFEEFRQSAGNDINDFLDFRSSFLGYNTHQWDLASRRSLMKALSINIIYGLQNSEFNAISNIDCTVDFNGINYPAIQWDMNPHNIAVLADGYWVTDTSGGKHWILTKNGARIVYPISCPKHPNLLDILDIKNSRVGLPTIVLSA